MQGEKIGEESRKVTSQRVLPNPDGSPKMETSFPDECHFAEEPRGRSPPPD